MRYLLLSLTLGLSLAAAAQDDAALQQQVSNLLEAFTGYEQVEAEVQHGVVRLRGTVIQPDRIARIEEAIAGLDGVIAVDNQLEIDLAMRSRMDPMRERLLELSNKGLALLPLLGVALLLVLLFWFISRQTVRADFLLRHVAQSRPMRELILRTASAVIFIIGLVLALDILGATAIVGGILGAAGVVGIAIGFAFRDLIENYIASIMLSVRQPFHLDDHVVIDGHEGIVTSLSSRATMLLTLEGNSLRIPNGQVFKAVILNYSNAPERRFQIAVGLGYDVDIDAAQALGLKTLLAVDGVLDDPGPIMRVDKLGDSAVNIHFFAWVDQRKHNFGKVRTEAIVALKNAFAEHDFDMPEPSYRLRITETVPASPAPPKQAPQAVDAQLVERAENQQEDFVRRQSQQAREIEENLIDEE